MLKKLLIAAAGLLIAAPVLADNGHRHDRRAYAYGHGHHHHWKHYHRRPVVVMPPPRVFYSPPPRVVYAPPPRPIYHAPAGAISIRLHFPL